MEQLTFKTQKLDTASLLEHEKVQAAFFVGGFKEDNVIVCQLFIQLKSNRAFIVSAQSELEAINVAYGILYNGLRNDKVRIS